MLGGLWSLITPLLMLAVYTLVFGSIFQSRWRSTTGNPIEFAVVLFAGVLVHGFLAECLQRAPLLITSNPNFVKKVIFPLEVLTWVAIGNALFHLLIALLAFLAAVLLWQGHLAPTVLLVPVLLLPLLLLTAGLVWILSSLGVYLRDLSQIMSIATSILMFLAPVFYPLESAPERLRPLLYLNPITFIVVQLRELCIWGHGMDWSGWALYMVVACPCAWLGLWWFSRTSKGFADVL